ncbi:MULTISPECIES: homoserine kinase [Candidatus Nitrosocaldus]|jgi:homoserine kinase|uniref:Homoserine kinase n=1 Tax=Candidatus Nitrosocaldus cavascurensis TaxID=2058097 RepID=A0A2K5AT59_9ARCH|nr:MULTISPECIES: homoserine kinase [Candidatus Nitrosocaldus]SPC34821.1 Homoserine kinase [Candidatus Nitrosocaldus cavascurensis]
MLRRALYRQVKVSAPASTANLGPGFDVFGLAIDAYSDEVELVLEDDKSDSYSDSSSSSIPSIDSLTIEVHGSSMNAEHIPEAAEYNSAGLALLSMMKAYNIRDRIRVRVNKGIPAGYGLGSSAASAVAAVKALDVMYDLGLDDVTLLRHAAQGEIASAGTVHYDNVAASLLGGFVIVRQEPLYTVKVEPPEDLLLCVATPKVDVPKGKTGVARSVLPEKIMLRQMVSNVANASMLVAGFLMKDTRLIADAMMRDVVVEPARMHIIPAYASVKKAALDAGALAVTISGAGPSILIVVDANDNVKDVVDAVDTAYSREGIECYVKVCKIAGGVSVLECR